MWQMFASPLVREILSALIVITALGLVLAIEIGR
jgi:hypothetical protein